MPNSLSQNSFTAGEISPSSHGRVDIAKYQVGLKTCRNFLVKVQGGAINRTGTGFVCELKDSSKKGRLIPFQFNTTQGYCLQFEDGRLRVVKDGGQVLNAEKNIDSTTDATPVVVTSIAHGYANGDQVLILGTGISSLDGRYWIVANQTANTFELQGSTAPGATAATGTANRVFETVSPYTEAQIAALKYAQLNDVMTLTHNGVRPQDLGRTAHDAWTFTDMPFREGPFQDINAEIHDGVVVVGLADVNEVVTIQSSKAMFSAEQEGMLFYIEQKNFGRPWEVGKAVAVDAVRRSEGRYYKALNAATTGTLRPTGSVPGDVDSDGAVRWEYIHGGYGIVRLDTFLTSKTFIATVLNELPDAGSTGQGGSVIAGAEKTITGAADNGSGKIQITSAAHGYTNNDIVLIYDVEGTTEANGLWIVTGVTANTFDLRNSTFVNAYTAGGKAREGGTYKWAFGAWGGDQDWPAVVAYFQQRKMLAATPEKPGGIWGSATNAFDFFGKSTPLSDDDAISLTLAGNEANAIRHMFDLGKLVVFTAGNKWVIPDDDNSPVLTPTQRSARPQGSLGASDVRPAKIEESLLYVLDMGQSVQDLAYQFASNGYSGSDLSVLAEHLLQGHQVVRAAYQHTPFRTHWMIRDDGKLIGLTYLREHQVAGWHHHDSDGDLFEDVCVVREPPEDAVYFIVKRTIGGQTKRYVERLRSRLYADIKDAVFLDSSLTYDGRNTTSTTLTLTSSGATWGYDSGETFTVNASGNYFVSSHVGDEIHFTDDDGRILRCTIETFAGPAQVTVTINRDVPAELRNTATTAWGHAKNAFSGLDHLEGRTVAVLADGHVHPTAVVASGAVALDFAATVVHVGLPITADFETLDLNVLGQETVRDKEKLVSKVTLLVEESRGIFAGEDFDNLLEYPQRDDENYDEPVEMLTGQAEIKILSTWSKGGRVCVRQTDPLPLSILGAIPRVELGGAS